MRRPKPGDVLFWALAAVAAVLFALFLLVLAGVFPIGTADPPVERPGPVAAPSAATTEADEPVGPARPAPPAEPQSSTAGAENATPELVTVVVTATRGDCWLAARAGSETGPVLEERLLVQGESVRFRAARVWLSLGASGNVDVLVDQRPREVPAGTVALVLAPGSTT